MVQAIELCAKSYYSLLEGVSSPEELIERAVELKMPALGLVDKNGLYGASTFYKLCKEAGIHPILGAEITIEGTTLSLLCETMEGYSNLSQMLTEIHRGGGWEAISRFSKGLLCLLHAQSDRALDIFGRNQCYALAVNHLEPGGFQRWGDLPLVASNLSQYATPEKGKLLDILLCVNHRETLRSSQAIRPVNHERYLKSNLQLPSDACARTFEIADRCQVNLDFSSYRFPDWPDSNQKLRDLCLPKCSPQALPELNHEMELIEKLGLSSYFLTVWDLMEYARKEGIPAQGRGSAANSLVAYLLGITPVDPIKHELFLGRFIHEGMETVPDIDIDFAATRHDHLLDREDVIQYVYDRYGADHVAMVCTFVTFQKKSARNEVRRVLELKAGEEHPLFEELVEGIKGIPRHLSIHVGGMLIASRPISQLVPLQAARMEGRIVCQWDKDMVEDAGLVKVDILSLGMLSLLRDVSQMTGIPLDDIPQDDPAVYEMLGAADTVGLFQVESRAQMQSLPRTRPKNLPELGVQVAIIRPGPLQGNMVSPYIRRRQGKEEVSYPDPCLEPVLKETLGVILFQEQVLQVAVAMADFSQTDAAALRKAMSRKRSSEAMERLRRKFIEGAARKGISREQAEEVFFTLRGFASYGFCKSHALSFATIAYRSAWLKRYHPASYTAALLNNQPMGFYSAEVILEDAKRHGVQLLPIDPETHYCTVEDGKLRLGTCLVSHVSKEKLITLGAYGENRREQLWDHWAEDHKVPLFDDQAPTLPSQTRWDKLKDEFSLLGFSMQGHPFAFLRTGLSKQGFVSSNDLPNIKNKTQVRVGGLPVCRQRPPTAKGFCFITLEDELGLMNLIIPPDLFEAQEALIRSDSLLAVDAIKESQDGILNLRALAIYPLEVSTF